jgi:hypothetical protein
MWVHAISVHHSSTITTPTAYECSYELSVKKGNTMNTNIIFKVDADVIIQSSYRITMYIIKVKQIIILLLS